MAACPPLWNWGRWSQPAHFQLDYLCVYPDTTLLAAWLEAVI